MVPVRGLHGRHEIGDARTVLTDAHGNLAGGAGVAVAHEARIALVCHIPEGDPGLGEEVGYRHEGGADDPEHVLDPVPLQHLHEGLFSRHIHRDTLLFPFVPFPRRSGVVVAGSLTSTLAVDHPNPLDVLTN